MPALARVLSLCSGNPVDPARPVANPDRHWPVRSSRQPARDDASGRDVVPAADRADGDAQWAGPIAGCSLPAFCDRPPGRTGHTARFAYVGPNRVMHKKAGLCLLTALITRPGGQTFAKLKRQCALTDSKQSRDMKVLQDNGLVRVRREIGTTAPTPTPASPPKVSNNFWTR